MKRVLFVDDEPMILEGLRNVLRRQRSKWEMTFVTSGAAAIEAFELAPFDVIVSDMRMPGMDGAALLKVIRDRFPQTARVILSGQASGDELLRALPEMQQFLSKPCNPDELCDVVERLCRIQSLLDNEKIRDVIGRMDGLPSFPSTYAELNLAMGKPNVSLSDVGAIVRRDPGLSVKVLQLANSAYCGQAQHTSSVQSAVRHVGLDVIKALALSTHVFSALNATSMRIPALCALPDRSLEKAELASRLNTDGKRADEAFTAALLLNIGQILLARCCGSAYTKVVDTATSSGRPLHDVEQEVLGVTHAEVGGYLLGIWGLPPTLVELVACHHAPALLTLTSSPLLDAVHIADALVDAIDAGMADPLEAIEPQFRQRPELNDRLEQWKESLDATARVA